MLCDDGYDAHAKKRPLQLIVTIDVELQHSQKRVVEWKESQCSVSQSRLDNPHIRGVPEDPENDFEA
jgi:hypothetical protein